VALQIRPFKNADAEELSSMIRSTLMEVNIKDSPAFAIEEQHGEYGPEPLKALAKERDIFVVVEDDKIVGSVAREGNHISTLFVDHKLRKQGIGRILLKFIENKIKEDSYDTAELTSGPTALTWYEKMGYSETEKQFDRKELTGIHMLKNL
jgi:GNAT superfamily N-acetyltransferase